MSRPCWPRRWRRHRSSRRHGIILYLSLLPVAMPWLRLEQQRVVGIWLLCPVLVAALALRDRRLKAVILGRLGSARVPVGALAVLVLGLATVSLFDRVPFYGVGAWVAVLNGLIAAVTGMTVAAVLTGARCPVGDVVAPAACAASLTALVVLPVLVAPSEMSGLVDTLRSGSADKVIAEGYRPLFDAIDASPLIVLPEARNTNLRHEPALVLALALAPIGIGRRSSLGRGARLLAATTLLLTLSRSAIGAGLLVAGLAGVVAIGGCKQAKQAIVPLLTSLGAIAVLVSPLGDSLGDRFRADDRSTVVRSEAISASVDLLGRHPLGAPIEQLPPDFVRPHLFLLDAYLGIGVLGLAVAIVVLGLLANQALTAFRHLRHRSAGPVAGLILALGIVALVRYSTSGSFLHATVAWYGMGATVGWQAARSADRRRSIRRSSDRPRTAGDDPTAGQDRKRPIEGLHPVGSRAR